MTEELVVRAARFVLLAVLLGAGIGLAMRCVAERRVSGVVLLLLLAFLGGVLFALTWLMR